MKVLHVIGARPNFMKVAPVIAALATRDGVSQVLVHTGQHYDERMSGIFFQELGLPRPDINLEVGSGSHASQTAQIMTRFEDVVQTEHPDMVLVYGDVNSTVAAALVCAKLLVPVGHVEAGLRSGDRTMPEEINRLVTDAIADLHFTPSSDGDEHLLREGVARERIHLVGNVMIDTLVRLLPDAEARWPSVRSELGLRSEGHASYALVTLHRPSNVDTPEGLRAIMAALQRIGQEIPIIFPVHPRTRARLQELGLTTDTKGIKVVDPLGYLDFLALQRYATVVITDSGGVQEETTYLGIPCLTLRENTERPVTVTMGTNILLGHDMERLYQEVMRVIRGDVVPGRIPPLWDGRAGERIADVIVAR